MRYLFFEKDIKTIKEKIDALEKKIGTHSKEMGKASHESAETWHDNAPFEIAVSQIKFLGDRVKEWEKLARDAEIVKPLKDNDQVQVGSIVQTVDDGQKKRWYKIGGYLVFDKKKRMAGHSSKNPLVISYASPFGSALLKKKTGDKIEINGQNLKIGEIINNGSI